MQYLGLATDYDGTIAKEGKVADETVTALKRFASSGRKLLLVTGRQLEDLKAVFPEWNLFHCIVAENGGHLFWPATGEIALLAPPPQVVFVRSLEAKGVEPLSVGRTIVATVDRHLATVEETVRDLGLNLHVSLNKGSVMVLPTHVDKSTGLVTASSLEYDRGLWSEFKLSSASFTV